MNGNTNSTIGHQQNDDCIIDAALQILSKRFARGNTIDKPEKAKQYLALKLHQHEREVFACLFLDTKHRIIAFEELFYGTIDAASVYPREIVKRSLLLNAGAVILVHNHPSGVCEPSRTDEQITRRIKDALALIDVTVLDHIIVGGGEAESLAERCCI